MGQRQSKGEEKTEEIKGEKQIEENKGEKKTEENTTVLQIAQKRAPKSLPKALQKPKRALQRR